MMNIKKPDIKRDVQRLSKRDVLMSLKKEIEYFKGKKNSNIYLLKELSETKKVFSQTDIRKLKGYEIRDKNGNKTKEYLKTMKQLRTFEEQGYITKIGKDRGQIFYEIEDFVMDELTKINDSVNNSFKITVFDKHILELADDEGKLDLSKINEAKKESIFKRIETYKRADYIKENTQGVFLSKKIMDDIKAKAKETDERNQRKKDRVLNLNLSIPEEMVINDINRFGMLTKSQITKYIGKLDYKALLKENILEYDKKHKVYTLGSKGILYAKALDKNALKYKTKAQYRREEIEHDKLIYTEYKKEVDRLESIGAKIVGTYTDRELRSLEAKKYGHIVSSLPDFRIEYYVKGVSGICRLDIEIDVGYKDEVIAAKIKGMVSSAQKDGIKSQNYSLLWVKKSKMKINYNRIIKNAKVGVENIKPYKKMKVNRGKNKIRSTLRLIRSVNKMSKNFKQKRARKPNNAKDYLKRMEIKKAEEEI